MQTDRLIYVAEQKDDGLEVQELLKERINLEKNLLKTGKNY